MHLIKSLASFTRYLGKEIKGFSRGGERNQSDRGGKKIKGHATIYTPEKNMAELDFALAAKSASIL